MLLRKTYKPKHEENLMKNEGDVAGARAFFFSTKHNNLRHLLHNRYNWMNSYIKKGDKGIDLGCGSGLSKEFIKSKNFQITDFADYPWLDIPNVDALSTRFDAESIDYIVSSNMIHHVPYPLRFFEEAYRILKPGGVILIQEIHASFMMRLFLRLMRHEGYSFDVNVFDREEVCTDESDLWSANCAIPRLLFDDIKKWEREVPNFKILKYSYSEFLTFLNSGGVIAKVFFIPLPLFVLSVIEKFDSFLSKVAPNIFALQRQIVLKKQNP
jgi:ubiquinone/menaquinone biosynthesis C-methylase UbiE